MKLTRFALAGAATLSAHAQTEGFDTAKPGSLPPGWECGITGKGTPRWSVERDPTARSAPQVLQQSGAGAFPWCVKKDAALADGYVEVKFKALRGKGRTLVPLEPGEPTELEEKLAETEALDPESAGEEFEPLARPGLLARLKR